MTPENTTQENTPDNKKNTSPLLEVRDLHTWFHTEEGVSRAVDGVSFSINKGETLGIVGESGCGKSITALSILKLVPSPGRVESGEVIFEGENILHFSEERMQRIRGNVVSMIFQEPMTALNPVFTVGDQVAESFRLHRGFSRKEARDAAVEMLDKVGIPSSQSRSREFPHQMSGGMRQRAMIAMALACEPELLIADEPTTALDVTVQAQILDLIAELQEKTGTAVQMITHDLGVVGEMTRDVAVMYAGQIVEAGPTAKVFDLPAHPYTQGLMASIPKLGGIREGKALSTIEGTVPSPHDWPPACRFHPRCPYAQDICRTDMPPLEQFEGDHYSACHFKHEIAGRDFKAAK
ncbi:MAG: ABC transporter ATP-binding protein [Candidatus Sumerlaeia bacterium]